MVQIIPQEGGFGTQFGAGLGRGLSDQIPKEVGRSLLSSGLKNLSKESGNLSPLEQASKLYGIPGMTPENLQYLMPLLQQHQQRQAFANQNSATSSPPMESVSSENASVNPRSNSNYLLPSSPEQIQANISKLASDPRYLNKSVDELTAIANEQDARRVAADQATEHRIDLGNKRFDSMIGEYLQKSGQGTYEDITGQLSGKFRNELQDKIAMGENPQKAASEIAHRALDFAKARTNFTAEAAKSVISRSPEKLRKSINAIRKSYEKEGAQEAFADDLVAKLGLSPRAADSLAFPVQENKELWSHLDKVKSIVSEEIYDPASQQLFSKNRKGHIQISAREVAQKIEPLIGENDSLNSIALELGKKGYDEQEILDRFQEDYEQGKMQLNERQLRELQKTKNWFPSLGDLYFFSMIGEQL